jgi:hypothetical protein
MIMKLAIDGRSPRIATQLVYALALALVLTVLVFASSVLFMQASTAAPPARTPAPISAPANYRLPSEPVDYNDPNYIGSYGG